MKLKKMMSTFLLISAIPFAVQAADLTNYECKVSSKKYEGILTIKKKLTSDMGGWDESIEFDIDVKDDDNNDVFPTSSDFRFGKVANLSSFEKKNISRPGAIDGQGYERIYNYQFLRTRSLPSESSHERRSETIVADFTFKVYRMGMAGSNTATLKIRSLPERKNQITGVITPFPSKETEINFICP